MFCVAGVTVPWPPGAEALIVNCLRVKVSVTLCAPSMVTLHVPTPLHPPPDQPVKVELAWGTALRVTVEPWMKLPVQVAPQLIPAGMDVTVPLPVTVFGHRQGLAVGEGDHYRMGCGDVGDDVGARHGLQCPVIFDCGDVVAGSGG